jgi:hypothetical protein
MVARDLLKWVCAEPFHPVDVELRDGTRIRVTTPTLLVSRERALFVTNGSAPRAGQ